MSVAWPSDTARRRQILRDGFDSRLEPIAFDIYTLPGGCWLEERKLTSQPPSITAEFSVQYNLKITLVIYIYVARVRAVLSLQHTSTIENIYLS